MGHPLGQYPCNSAIYSLYRSKEKGRLEIRRKLSKKVVLKKERMGT